MPHYYEHHWLFEHLFPLQHTAKYSARAPAWYDSVLEEYFKISLLSPYTQHENNIIAEARISDFEATLLSDYFGP